MTDREKLIEILAKYFDIGDSYAYNLTREKSAFSVGTMSLDDFEEFDEDTIEDIADYLLANGVIVLPCREGDTIYKISKFCEANTGYKEFYRPTKEFEDDCKYYEPQHWADDCEECFAPIMNDDYEPYYCSLNLDIYCEKCKERFAIQKDVFTLSKAHQVYNAPMFNSNTELRDTYFRTKEEAEKALAELKNTK